MFIYSELSGRPTYAAGLIQCVGRLNYMAVKDIGTALIIAGFNHRHVEVREASISAIEHWGGGQYLKLLKQHRDPVDWMNDYISNVISDLSER